MTSVFIILHLLVMVIKGSNTLNIQYTTPLFCFHEFVALKLLRCYNQGCELELELERTRGICWTRTWTQKIIYNSNLKSKNINFRTPTWTQKQ